MTDTNRNRLNACGTVSDDGDITIPPLADTFVAEFRDFLVATGDDETDDEDELFDTALDFVMGHETAGPFALNVALHGEETDAFYDHEDEAVELGREWAYALMEAVGRPYGE